MTSKKFRWVIFLLASSLVALIGVQLYWINHAIRLKEEQFNVKVNDALKDAAARIENESVCFETFSKIMLKHHEGLYMIRQKCDSAEQFISPVIAGRSLVKNLDTIPLHFSYASKTDTLYTFNSLKFNQPASAEILVRFQYDMSDTLRQEEELSDSGKIERLTASAFKRLNTKRNPFGEQIDNSAIDSILQLSLVHEGIRLSFQYVVLSADSTPVFTNTSKKNEHFAKSDLQATLFQGSYFTDPFKLILHFPDRRTYILQTMLVVLLSSALVIILLLVAFYFGMRIILRQKKLSELKNDFINNMTHEFKTPVSVISLALETVNTSQVMNDKEKLEKILGILKTESKRLETQVERILQFSSFERHEIKMDFRETDLHQLVHQALENFSLQVENKKADITLALNASVTTINGDEIHITNLVCNLVDNAIKYRNGNVQQVKIETMNQNGNVYLSIEDNGIGMEKHVLPKIFDKFYRIPTGDIHNIKGFGLGLSYVKTIVEAHSGSISVESEPGKGSRFTITFPQQTEITHGG